MYFVPVYRKNLKLIFSTVQQETMLHKTVNYYIVLSLNPSSSFQTHVFRIEATHYASVWPEDMNTSLQTVHHPHAHARTHTHILVHLCPCYIHHTRELYASLFVSLQFRQYKADSTYHKQVNNSAVLLYLM